MHMKKLFLLLALLMAGIALQAQVTISNDSDADQSAVRIFPNPTDGVFYIEILRPVPDEYRIFVLDQRGKLAWKEWHTNTPHLFCKIDLTGKKSGIYYVLVFMKNESFSGKVKLQHEADHIIETQ